MVPPVPALCIFKPPAQLGWFLGDWCSDIIALSVADGILPAGPAATSVPPTLLTQDMGSSIALQMRARTSSMMLELEVSLLATGRDLADPDWYELQALLGLPLVTPRLRGLRRATLEGGDSKLGFQLPGLAAIGLWMASWPLGLPKAADRSAWLTGGGFSDSSVLRGGRWLIMVVCCFCWRCISRTSPCPTPCKGAPEVSKGTSDVGEAPDVSPWGWGVCIVTRQGVVPISCPKREAWICIQA